MDLLERLKQLHKDFLVDAEDAFLSNTGVFAKEFKALCPIADLDSFSPILMFADKLYCVGFACDVLSTTLQENAVDEVKAMKKLLIQDKRALLKNFRAGAYDAKQEEENFDLMHVEAWLRNGDYVAISDFAFFSEIRPTTKAKYYLHEFLYYAYQILAGFEEKEEEFVKYPASLVGIPLFMLSANKPPERMVNKKKGTVDFYFENVTASGSRVKTFVGKDIPLPDVATEEALEQIGARFLESKALGPFDHLVFVTLFNMISADTASKGYLVVSLKDFVKHLTNKSGKELTDSVSDTKEKIKSSLYKFKNYDILMQEEVTPSGKRKSGGAKAYNLIIDGYYLDYADETVDYTGKLRVDFSKSFLNSWLSAVTEKVVSETWANASQNAKNFLFYLQNQRVLSRPSDFVSVIELNSMMSSFPGKRKDKFLDDLKSALDELIANKTIVKKYEVKSPFLNITFLPLSDEEEKAYQV